MGSTKCLVHVNRVRLVLNSDADVSSSCGSWSSPLFTHYESVAENGTSERKEPVQETGNSIRTHHMITRSGQIVRPPDYY